MLKQSEDDNNMEETRDSEIQDIEIDPRKDLDEFSQSISKSIGSDTIIENSPIRVVFNL
jgi:hypothetical protein